MVALAYASLPDLSKVSKILKDGNIAKTWFLYPGTLVIGLLIKSNCNNCLKPLNTLRFYSFYTLLAPNIKVWICFEFWRYWRCSPGIELNTKSSLINAGRFGKFYNETIPQSFNVNICKYLYLSSSFLTSAVKYPPNLTETMSIT